MLDKLFRSLPHFKGKNRLANVIFKKQRNEVTIITDLGTFVLPNTIENQYFELFYNGEYEVGLVNYVCETLPKNAIMFDIGANVGSIAVPIALKRPDILIYCFEGLSRNFEFLERNVKLNKLTNIIISNVVLSDANGNQVKFYYDEMLRGKSSFHNLYSSSYELHITKTLDAIIVDLDIDRLDFVKIDTEGSEGLILKGAIKTLIEYKPEIHFEYNSEYESACGLIAGDSQRDLLALGYKLYSPSTNGNQIDINLKEISFGGGDLIARYN